MPRFGETWFGGYYFGDDDPPPGYYGKSIGRIPLGLTVRKQFSKKVIFKVVRGNGFYGSIKGKPYQTIKKYFVPTSINNPEGEPYRIRWKEAVKYWQTTLTDEQKKEYNVRATKGLRMSGYNLFIREYMKEEIQMFFNRGDPMSVDFTLRDLTLDNTWRDLDLSSIVPAGAKAVALYTSVLHAAPNKYLELRRNGNYYIYNRSSIRTQVADMPIGVDMTVPCDSNRVVEYRGIDGDWVAIEITVKGWWT